MPLALSAFGCAATAGIYGALIVAPQAGVINVLLYFFVLSPRYLPHAMVIGLSAIAGPIVLELVGVTSAYRPVEGGIVIVEQGLAIGHTSMLLFGMATAVFGLIAGAVAAAYFHARLAGSEQQLFLRDWHLRQMVGSAD